MFDFYLSYTYQKQHLLNNYDAFERKFERNGNLLGGLFIRTINSISSLISNFDRS